MEKNDYNQALNHLDTVLNADPFDSRTLYSLGVCYEKLGKLDEASSQYRKVKTKNI